MLFIEDQIRFLLNELISRKLFWLGKDVNVIVKDFTNLGSPFDDFINRMTTPRMPWHVGMCVFGLAGQDEVKHFIQRWKDTKLEKAKNNK